MSSLRKPICNLFCTNKRYFSFIPFDGRVIEIKKKTVNKKQHIAIIEEQAKALNVKEWKDWYRFGYKDVNNKDAKNILKHYNNSLITALMTLYPEHEWKPWEFSHSPRGFWEDTSTRKMFFESMKKSLGFTTWQDWYKISWEDFREHGGTSMLVNYDNSPSKAIMITYPEHDWKVWKFNSPPKYIWEKKETRIAFLEDFAKTHDIEFPDGWYRVKVNQVKEHGGGGLLFIFDNSLRKLLESIYPDIEWKIWLFQDELVPSGYWTDKKNQRIFLEYVGKAEKYTSIEDYYNLTSFIIDKYGGHSLLKNYYGTSVSKFVKAVFNEHSFEDHLFKRTERNLFSDEAVVRKAMDYIEKQLGITTPEDWFDVSYEMVQNLGYQTLLKRYGGIVNLITAFYPQLPVEGNFHYSLKKVQQLLFKTIKDIFSDKDVHNNYPHPNLLYKESQKPMQLDVYIPALNLAFEYQGEHHFQPKFYHSYKGDYESERTKIKDIEKLNACEKLGITLIAIPYWWDCTKESLMATINKYRPNTFELKESIEPISNVIPTTTPRKQTILMQKPSIVLEMLGSTSQASKCRTCGKTSRRNEFRINAVFIDLGMNKEYVHRYCVNMDCITKGLDRIANTYYPDYQGKLFDGTVTIQDPLKRYMNDIGKKPPNVPGIKWIESK